MSRPKGSKNKEKAQPIVAGNPLFNLAQAEPVDPNWRSTDLVEAPSAVTQEDLEFERELDRMALETPMADIEPELVKPLTKEKVSKDHLRDHIEGEYRMAKTLNELDHQVAIAKRLGCDSIDATKQVIEHYCGKDYPVGLGFFMYKDIRVHYPEQYEVARLTSKMTVEQKLFGNSKVK